MIYTVKWADTPYPAWDGIEKYMMDDTGWNEPEGKYIGVYDGKNMAGAFIPRPLSMVLWDMHGGVSKKYWGQGADVCFEAGMFLFRNSTCMKIVATVPESNMLMAKCLEKIGMKKEGVLSKAFLKNYRLQDLIIYSANKSEVISCQPQ